MIEKKNPKTVPFMNVGLALQSLRDSGHSLPTALAEPIDNSLEAGANRVTVLLEESSQGKKKHIHRVSIIDDGEGMPVDVLHGYLQLGFSTRYMSTKTIGKYGVGAKLAALNFALQVDVWSRKSEKEGWLHVGLDLDEVLAAGERGDDYGIEEPAVVEFPEEIAPYVPAGTGTIVVWSRVDRLEEGRWAEDANALRLDVEKELSRIFRFFLQDGREIRVNDTKLLPHDPLLLMEGTWADQVLSREYPIEQKGKGKKGKNALRHFPADIITEREPIEVDGSTVYLSVTVYPREVLRQRLMGGDTLAKKLRIPDNLGSLSFVRHDREIAYTNVPRILPAGVKDKDRFIGIEVAFKPELDGFFGVRNVKRGVEPHGELRKLIRERLKRYIPTARKKIQAAWGAAEREEEKHTGTHAPVANAVADADKTLPRGRAETPESDKVEKKLRELAEDVGKTDPDAQKAYIDSIRELPFVVESMDFPGKEFMNVEHLGQKVIVRLNTRHRFYKEMWGPIVAMSKQPSGTVSGDDAVDLARRSAEALDLMVIAYAKAESMHQTPDAQYGDLRTFWGQFLDTLLGKVKDVL